jgi:hypothetical protein
MRFEMFTAVNIWNVVLQFVMPFSSHLGGVVVSVLASRPKGCGFKPGRGDGFLSSPLSSSFPVLGLLRPVTGITELNPSIFSKVFLNFFSLLVGILGSFL